MNPYELVVIIEANIGEENINAILTKTEEKIKSFGGEISKVDKWGLRRLQSVFGNARKATQGYYTVIYFSANPDVPKKVQTFLKVTDNVIRASIMKAVVGAQKEEKSIEGVPLAAEEIVAVPVPEIKEEGFPGGQS